MSSLTNQHHRVFSGKASDFRVWMVRLKGLLSHQKLLSTIDGSFIPKSSTQTEKDSHKIKSSEAMFLIHQCLNDTTLNLIIDDT